MEKYAVLMSVYRNEKPEFFHRAIESMLQQTVPPSEFVIVCDGELTQELWAVIDGYCGAYEGLFHVVKLPENRGLGLALRAGLEACGCELVARMDTDDVSVPDRMEKQLEKLAAEEDLSAVGGQISEFEGEESNILDYRMVPLTCEDIRRRAASRNPMNHVTVVMKKSHVLSCGSYCHAPGFEDYHLWVRMLRADRKLANIDHVCCNVRVDSNMYGRRGGWRYFKSSLAMEKFLHQQGFIGPVRLCVNVTVRFLGTVVCPNWLRSILFKTLMRKNG